jgi:hypothetical protein
MRQIEPKTIDKVARFLKVIKDSEGKELDLKKVVGAFNLSNSFADYARKEKLIDFVTGQTKIKYKDANGNEKTRTMQLIKKADFKLIDGRVEPIVARKLIMAIAKQRKENEARKSGVAVAEVVETKVEEQKQEYVVSEREYVAPKKEEKAKKLFRYKVRIFGVHIGNIEPEYA